MERLDSGFLDGTVHPFGLTVGPGMVWLSEFMFDPVLVAYAVEDVRPEVSPTWPVTVLRQIGECHSVIGEHRMNGIRKSVVDHTTQETRRRSSCRRHRGTRCR
jgi:hypothetical protein